MTSEDTLQSLRVQILGTHPAIPITAHNPYLHLLQTTSPSPCPTNSRPKSYSHTTTTLGGALSTATTANPSGRLARAAILQNWLCARCWFRLVIRCLISSRRMDLGLMLESDSQEVAAGSKGGTQSFVLADWFVRGNWLCIGML